MPGPSAAAALTPALPPPTSAFVVAAEPATTQPDSDLFFGELEGLEAQQRLEEVDAELVEEVVGEIRQIKGNSGVGSPEVRKYVDAWSPPAAPFGAHKEAALRSLAEALYQRRPVLYLKGHAQPYPAQVLLRTVRKPSVGAVTHAAAAAGLFKSPSNTVIVIKFDPQFGYADIIVDPFFTDAFIQQPSTATYSKLLSELPRAFVGTATELRRMVALLTQQSMRAYASKGATCPPWRRFDAMLARWLPKRYTDQPITHGPGAAADTAAPVELLRSDSNSSSESGVSSVSGWSLTMGGVSDAASCFSSSASSVPRTVVHGFDVPVKAAAAAAASEPEQVAKAAPRAEAVVAVAASPAAPAAVASSEEQQRAAKVDSTNAKLAAAAAAESESAAATGSWQLAAGMILEPVDEADGGESSSTSSKAILTATAKVGGDDHVDYDVITGSGLAAAATVAAAEEKAEAASRRTAAAADPSAQLLAAHGYSSRVVRLRDPVAAAAAVAAAAGGRVRGANATATAAADPSLLLLAAPRAAARHGSKRAYEPGVATNEGVCCDYEDLTGLDIGLVPASFSAVGKAAGQQAMGLAGAVARIREAVMHADVGAAVPVAGAREVSGRKVVRLDPASGVVCGCVQHSARAA